MAGNILRVKNQQGNWVNIPAIIGPQGAPGTTVYSELEDKPSINNVTLVGNKTSEQLSVVGTDKVVQVKGQDTSNVMSQKAVTDELDARPVMADSEVVITPNTDVYTKGQCDAKFFEKTNVSQSTGIATDQVMSQKAVTDELNTKEDISNKKNVVNNSAIEYPTSKAVMDYVEEVAMTENDIVQTIGESTTSVMSQNATTEALRNKENTYNKKDTISNSTTEYPSSKAVVDYALAKTDIVQSTGTAQDKVMSQDAVNEALKLKENSSNKKTEIADNDTDFPTSGAVVDYAVSKSSVVQVTGQSTVNIMSQKTVTDQLGTKEDSSNKKDNISNSTTEYPSSKAVVDYAVPKTDVSQSTGQSTTSIMSQKAVTDQLGTKEDSSNKKTEIADNDTDFPTSGAVVDYAVPKSAVVQIKGTSTTDVISQNSITTELNMRPVAVAPSSVAVTPGISSYSSLSGPWAFRPSGMYVGYQYFCTDKKTTEGNRNGILIIYSGSDVWVDALGRIIS